MFGELIVGAIIVALIIGAGLGWAQKIGRGIRK